MSGWDHLIFFLSPFSLPFLLLFYSSSSCFFAFSLLSLSYLSYLHFFF